ncbi:DUF3619 family protein [Nitrosovibrio sp. Nv4]|uniref:DUF3619 family protein n=1 Tax=Nitrosovibrio sp. Nv4 TaxID=1945880 RepID=UPI000BCBF627|nr:DUF3619 family protein [Nitrosovibrio sp. Nv4]SOD41213.1 Protein of unknown function [Nitrosovibrio sp. Nv4]
MNEPEIGTKIARLLDRGLDDMKQGTLNRLESARRASLENYHIRETVVGVDHGHSGQGASARSGHDWYSRTAKLLSAIALLFALASIAYWQTLQQSDENEDIDIMLLVDDLPINAYLDDEFDTWLDHY